MPEHFSVRADELVDRERAEWVANRPELVRANLADEKPVLEELRAAGLEARDLTAIVYDIHDIRPYIPILKKWWRLVERDATKCTIIRCLMPHAKEMVPDLIEEFRSRPEMDSNYAGVIAHALYSMAGRQYFDDLAAMLRDESLPWRLGLVEAVAKFGEPSLVPIWLELLQHPWASTRVLFVKQILSALGKTRSTEALEAVKPYLGHEDSDVRAYAKRAVARLEREIAARGANKVPEADLEGDEGEEDS